MIKVAADVTVRIGSVVLGAWLCSLFAPMLLSERGTIGPSALQADAPALAVFGVIIATAVATFIAAIAARLTNPIAGVFILGAALFGLAWRTAGLHEMLISGSIPLLALETFLFAIPAMGAAWVVLRAGGPVRDIEPDPHGRHPHPWFSKSAGLAALCGFLVLPVVWVVARTATNGQALAAVFLGALAAGIASRLVAPHTQPRWIFVTPIVFGAIGLAVGSTMLDVPPGEAFVDRSYSPLLVPMPLDWLAASLMGSAFGFGWAKSFLHHEETEQAVRRAVRTSST